jgi:glycosyltransferase involved in cell wall biosynthesis
MFSNAIDVSVIIAAYQAVDFITTAVQSALAQQGGALEVIVAPDDAADYGFLRDLDPRVIVLDPLAAGQKPTGPAGARNRALEKARGSFIALLDADDYWSPNYLPLLLPLARAHGLAFGRTLVVDWDGVELRPIPRRPATNQIDYAHFADAFGSLHAVVRRDPQRHWHDILAEDVLFDIESLALADGTAPYAAEAAYLLRIRPQSASHSDNFINGIDAGYSAIIERIAQGGTLIPVEERAAAIAVFRAWQVMNLRFSKDHAADPSLEFHAYVAAL